MPTRGVRTAATTAAAATPSINLPTATTTNTAAKTPTAAACDACSGAGFGRGCRSRRWLRSENRPTDGKCSISREFCSNKCDYKRKRTIISICTNFVIICLDVDGGVLEENQVPQFSAEQQQRSNDAAKFLQPWSYFIRFSSSTFLPSFEVFSHVFRFGRNIAAAVYSINPDAAGHFTRIWKNVRRNGSD